MLWIAKVRYTNKNDAAADANQAAQTQFYQNLTNSYQEDLGQFDAGTSQIMSQLQPIVNAGPGQYGFSDAENNALMGSAINNDSAAAQSAQQATQEQITASNGGASLTPPGRKRS